MARHTLRIDDLDERDAVADALRAEFPRLRVETKVDPAAIGYLVEMEHVLPAIADCALGFARGFHARRPAPVPEFDGWGPPAAERRAGLAVELSDFAGLPDDGDPDEHKVPGFDCSLPPNPGPLGPERRTIAEWGPIAGVEVLDPDGFDRSDPDLWTRLFTRAEFDRGVRGSTVRPIRTATAAA